MNSVSELSGFSVSRISTRICAAVSDHSGCQVAPGDCAALASQRTWPL